MELLVDYWQIVNEEDLSTPYEYEIPGGSTTIPEARATLYMLLNEGAKIKLAYVGSDLVGFLIYHTVYRSSLVIRHLYSIRERSSTARVLVETALPEVRKLLFQTRKVNPPKRLLGLLKGARVLYEDDKLIDWEMEWL